MIKDIDLLMNISGFLERDTVIIGSENYGAKTCRLLLRDSIKIKCFYTDDQIKDCELKEVRIKKLSDFRANDYIEDTNVIIAFNDENYRKRYIAQTDSIKNVYSYWAFYQAMCFYEGFTGKNASQIRCMNTINHRLDLMDFKARWLKGIRWAEESGNNVLLWAIPKTGTQSMKSSLNHVGVNHTYIHYLNINHPLNELWPAYFEENDNLLSNICDSEYLNNHYLDHLMSRQLKIIVSIREPIAQAYSSVFQAIKNWGIAPLRRFDQENIVIAVKDYILKSATKMFNWYDEEIKLITGIDLFSGGFDREQGISIYKHEKIEVLFYKIENNKKLSKTIGDFVNENDFSMEKIHESKKEEYAFVYKELKKYLNFSEDELDRIYGNRKMRYIYTDKEIDEFRSKWKGI